MNNQTGYFGVILSSMMLMACGGSPGDSSESPAVGGTATPNAPAAVSAINPGLAKYAGIWHKDCVDHMRLTMTATATGANSFSVSRNQEYFANADCTGAIVANGNYGVPDETVQYTAPLQNVSVQLLTGATIVTNVDPGSSVLANARFNFSGPGVLASIFESIVGKTVANIQYAEKVKQEEGFALRGQSTSGALLLLDGELLSLVAIDNSTSSFRVNQRYIR